MFVSNDSLYPQQHFCNSEMNSIKKYDRLNKLQSDRDLLGPMRSTDKKNVWSRKSVWRTFSVIWNEKGWIIIDNNDDSSTLRVLTFWRKMLSLTNNRPIFK